MEIPVPNQALIRHLLSTYYRDSPNAQDSQFISSHWKHYSNLINCEFDSEGSPNSLSSIGFGTYDFGGLSHRILDSACMLSHLVHLPSRTRILQLMVIASRLCRRMELHLTFDVFRQICSLPSLEKAVSDIMPNKPLRLLVIGDGFGVLSAVLKAIFPDSTVVMVDIGKVLLFQAYYVQKAHPDCTHMLAGGFQETPQSDFLYCPAEHLGSLDNTVFDVAVNIASMQEMSAPTISHYFTFLRSHLREENLFYCCNREFKKMPGGEITEFDKYPWIEDDRYLIDGYCPWHRYFFSHTSPVNNGPHLLGIRVPLVHFYASRIRHRLAVLSLSGGVR